MYTYSQMYQSHSVDVITIGKKLQQQIKANTAREQEKSN